MSLLSFGSDKKTYDAQTEREAYREHMEELNGEEAAKMWDDTERIIEEMEEKYNVDGWKFEPKGDRVEIAFQWEEP